MQEMFIIIIIICAYFIIHFLIYGCNSNNI